VDPNCIDVGAGKGLDVIQLLLIADGTSKCNQELATADTVNTDLNSGGPTDIGAPSPNPSSSNLLSEDSLGLGLSNGSYLMIAGVGLAAIFLLKRI
jgi:hypothetical protein